MKKFFSLLILLTVFYGQSLYAQVSTGGIPVSWTNDILPELNSAEVLPAVNVDLLKAEDEIEREHKDIPMRFAYGHEVDLSSSTHGSWYVFNNGDRLWRLKIKSKNALTMSVTFSSFNLPEGSSVFIYASDKTYSIGAFTAANNKASGYLGTTPIPGEEIVVEYFEPYNALFEAELGIETVAHGYRDIFKIAAEQLGDKGFGDSGDCNNNVVCPEAEDWEQQIKSVALITLSGGTRICTGSLLNNVAEDETPYFLTANHCLGSSSDTWVFIFNYFSDICDPGGSGNDGSTLESVAGSTLLENTNSNGGSASTDPNETDMALLLLDEDIPESYDVFYNGWDWSGDIPANTVCIHHPSGDVKKITWDNDEPKITGYFDESANGDLGGTTHWRIDAWEDGTTEGGSSGSPLFNDDKQVIGQLHGGVASCFNNINDYYGRLALSFDYIKEWLDPDSSGVTSINGYPNPVILAVDPGLRSIQDIEATYCDVNTISPTIVLKNYGSTEVTAIDIDYYLNGNLEGSINWTGSLMNGETADVVVDDITIPSTGNHIFSAEFDYLNDENLNNNERSFSFFATLGGIEIDLSILTDDWGSETSWAIFTLDGDEIASGSGYGPNFSPTLFEEQICVPDTCIEFVIYDSADDGICCDYGEGAYSVSYNGVEMVSGGEFSSEESTEICPNLIDNIAEVNPLEAISIYPNPANDKLFIKLNNFPAQDLNMRLFNLMGQQLYNIDGQVDGSILSIEVATWPRGVYLLDISSEGWTRSIKVILD